VRWPLDIGLAGGADGGHWEQDARAARGDPTSHGGIIVKGCPTVLIGSSVQAETLRTDKPFCEDCERKRRQQEAKKKRSK
jgi:hypothetical protein